MEENNQANDNLEPNTNAQVDENVNPISENVQQQTTYGDYSQNATTKKKGNGKLALLIPVILIVIAILGALIYYFGFYTKPEQMYKRLVSSTIDSYTKQIDDMNYKTAKVSTKLDVDVELENNQVDQEILDLINKTDIKLDVQTDNENKQVIVDIESNYDKEDLLDIQLYSNVKDEKTYIYLKDLLDKYIEAEVDEEYYETLSELLEVEKISKEEKASMKKAASILKKEITAMIKSEYCSSQKEEVKVGDKTVNATKNTIKMTATQVKDEFITLFTNLKDNEEFIKCFENDDDVVDALETAIEEFEDLEDDDKSTMEFSIYTNGLMQELVKVSAVAYTEESDQIVTINFTKTSDTTYAFEALSDDETVFTGSITVEEKSKTEGTTSVEFEIEDLAKIKFDIEYSQEIDKGIDKVNVKDSINSDELTQADQQTLLTNLQKSKLYELIQKFAGENNTSGMIDNNTTITDGNTDLEDDDTNTITNNTTTDILKDNQIISYDNKMKITFGIPAGYEVRRISENYVTLDKNNSSIVVKTAYGTKQKYYEGLESTKKYYLEDATRYKNVNLSNMESIVLNGRTFYSAVFSYESVSGSYTYKYNKQYVWSEISDNYVVDVEIRTPENITEEELKQILTITVENN